MNTRTDAERVDTAREATGYRIRIAGHLDNHWTDWFGGFTITRNDDGTTSLTGAVADQAQLHGILAAVRDIGATLLEVTTATKAAYHSASQAAPQPRALDRALHTDRLTLRPAGVEDAEATWAFRRLDAVNEWLTGTPDDIAGYRELFAEPDRLSTTVILQLGHDPDAQVIGDLMLRREDAWAQLDVADLARGAQAELGWVLDPAHTGHGYATEAVRELLRYCFEDLGVRRVVASCFLANQSSWRLMERVGMRRETHARRESLHRSGQWLDTLGYAVLADEWRAAHVGTDQRERSLAVVAASATLGHRWEAGAMLELRPNCECCDIDLPPESTEARICTFECTWCARCVEACLGRRCPNCGGDLQRRPVRPPAQLEDHPASTHRVVQTGLHRT
jgi:RimJ/RimL family protein N-acetyltransferase